MWYAITAPDGSTVYPIKDDGSEGRWRFGQARAQALHALDDLDFEFDGTRWQVYRKLRDGRTTYTAFGTLLQHVGTTADGTKALQELFHAKPLDFPKPVGLVRFLMEMGAWQDGDIVLDFFAGSGTTAHAVLEANRCDGGG